MSVEGKEQPVEAWKQEQKQQNKSKNKWEWLQKQANIDFGLYGAGGSNLIILRKQPHIRDLAARAQATTEGHQHNQMPVYITCG